MASKALTCGASPATTLARKSPSKVVSLSPCNVSFGVYKNPCLRSGNLVLRAQQSSGDIIESGDDLYRVPVQIFKNNTSDRNQPSGGERHPQRLPVDVLPIEMVDSVSQMKSMCEMVNKMNCLLEETMEAMMNTKGEVVRPRIPWEVKEEGGVKKIRFDMPGVSKDDVKVSVVVEEKMLIIKGERKEEGQDNTLWAKTSYNSFDTWLQLPDCEVDKIDACFKDGVLYISVPKTQIWMDFPIAGP